MPTQIELFRKDGTAYIEKQYTSPNSFFVAQQRSYIDEEVVEGQEISLTRRHAESQTYRIMAVGPHPIFGNGYQLALAIAI